MRRVDVERAASAPEAGRIEAPEHEVGVGHGGFGAAAAVADGSGFAARRLGPDVQAAAVDAGDRAAARADRVDVDHRERDAVAVAPVPVARELGPSVADEQTS